MPYVVTQPWFEFSLTISVSLFLSLVLFSLSHSISLSLLRKKNCQQIDKDHEKEENLQNLFLQKATFATRLNMRFFHKINSTKETQLLANKIILEKKKKECQGFFYMKLNYWFFLGGSNCSTLY
jgi:hypothetical protein